jgi:hypothetical protein
MNTHDNISTKQPKTGPERPSPQQKEPDQKVSYIINIVIVKKHNSRSNQPSSTTHQEKFTMTDKYHNTAYNMTYDS